MTSKPMTRTVYMAKRKRELTKHLKDLEEHLYQTHPDATEMCSESYWDNLAEEFEALETEKAEDDNGDDS
jgi:predicted nuclease with RNAse H fold